MIVIDNCESKLVKLTLFCDTGQPDSPGAKYFFEDLLHSPVRELFMHFKEDTLHLQ